AIPACEFVGISVTGGLVRQRGQAGTLEIRGVTGATDYPRLAQVAAVAETHVGHRRKPEGAAAASAANRALRSQCQHHNAVFSDTSRITIRGVASLDVCGRAGRVKQTAD